MGILSVASFAINYGLFVTLHKVFAVSSGPAAAFAMAAVVIVNFLGCKYYVYQELQGDSRVQFLRFMASTLVFRAVEWLTFVALTRWLSLDSILIYPLVLGVSFLVKLLSYRRLVFQQRGLGQ
jgi:putative flippase GtrA